MKFSLSYMKYEGMVRVARDRQCLKQALKYKHIDFIPVLYEI